jgi:uncharacterized protein YjbI with pentapeptide repeats
MAVDEHLSILKKGVTAWNNWRALNPNIRPDLTNANLTNANLKDANLTRANLRSADLTRANLPRAILTDANLKDANLTRADRASFLMTDESGVYKKTGREFSGHGTVNHSIKEYVRGKFFHSNTVENYFSILKRGVTGNYQWVSAKHLKRYLGEFDFRYNTRHVTDFERAALAAKGIQGKRLTYRRTGKGQASAQASI